MPRILRAASGEPARARPPTADRRPQHPPFSGGIRRNDRENPAHRRRKAPDRGHLPPRRSGLGDGGRPVLPAPVRGRAAISRAVSRRHDETEAQADGDARLRHQVPGLDRGAMAGRGGAAGGSVPGGACPRPPSPRARQIPGRRVRAGRAGPDLGARPGVGAGLHPPAPRRLVETLPGVKMDIGRLS